MQTTITKHALREFTEGKRSPFLRVVPTATPGSPLERARCKVPDAYPADEPLTLLFLGPKLDSPDVLQVKSSRMEYTDIVIELQHLDYSGELIKNIVTLPIVEVDLGPLAAGTYCVQAKVATWEFEDHAKPRAETYRGTESYALTVSVAEP
jgi:hypothetical protein